ncbi:acetyl-CoA carboxylase biotin carboxyl carrier protein subunit [Amycolatopsis acidicola]|uniref:Biotin carboxyl carrier protein of acetyl-CoA carboxylase n=1 Tax=Amycolatopsis acidicola TaxID=2596893 RepID=A0A5N0URP7_9PSEU|nr:acetyl-CoA carboxylase biotin carboxyl carrier protein subunit [Amycolatopsis acidicola]KAA9151259.1 acetyl-CoA carboxylase biotin carboxyl carrier protein subunit [Amycolatopsis acidicola]
MSAAINEDVDHVLTVLREQVLALAAEAGRAPSLVRVSSGTMVVEVEWDGGAAVLPELPAARPAPASVEAGPEPEAGTFPLCANTVGVFYRAPEPGAAPFVAEGDTIRPGQQVAILEAMKLMIPVEAERAGRVVRVLVEDGTAVEHGQPLLLLEAA